MMREYDKKSEDSILEYALKAKNHKISELVGEIDAGINLKDKGLVGNLLQEGYFGIPRNSSTKPDFEEAQLELKAFGYWEENLGAKADQRLALSKIDFMEFEKEVPFIKSHLYRKCRKMLFVIYLLKLNQARIDSEIKHIRIYKIYDLVESDFEQIFKDYCVITKKIRDGKASELSEGDTEILGAARTGDKNSKLEIAPKGDSALPRRFVFKQSYMSYLIREYILPEREFSKKITKTKGKCQIKITRGKTFEEWLNKIDSKYAGKTVKQISKLKAIKKVTGGDRFIKKIRL